MSNNYPRTLQVWPGGAGYTYTGDVDGPADQKRLKLTSYNGVRPKRWRKGTVAEWRAIRIEVRAELYGERDILSCDSSLVDDLINAASSGDCGCGDLADGFAYEEIRNLSLNIDGMNEDELRVWLNDNSVDVPKDANEDALRDLIRDNGGDDQRDVYEWWRVSGWLCNQLHAIGEVTIDNGYGHWWGRCCTGQGWLMDGTLQKVAALFEKDGQ